MWLSKSVMRKLKPLPHPSELPGLKAIKNNAGTMGMCDVINEHLKLDVIPIRDFQLVRAKISGRDGDAATKRLEAIVGEVIPNTEAWTEKFQNK